MLPDARGFDFSCRYPVPVRTMRSGSPFSKSYNAFVPAIEVEPSADQYRAQSNFVKKLKFLAQKYKLAVILIAHPRKEGENNALTAESVAGSGDITNLADTVLTYEKCPEKLSENDRFQSRIGVRKNRLTGKRLLNDETMVKVIYSVQTKRIVENESDGLKRICCFAESRKYVDNEPPF